MASPYLLHAAKACNVEEMRHLIYGGGTDVNGQDGNGNTALHWVYAHRVANADADAATRFTTASGSAAFATSFRRNTTVTGAAAPGSPDRQDFGVEDPLPVATVLAAAQVLIEAGADKGIQNKAGLTPLHVAARSGARIAISSLLQPLGDLREVRNARIAQAFTPLVEWIGRCAGADRATLFLVDATRKRLFASIAANSLVEEEADAATADQQTLPAAQGSQVFSVEIPWDRGLVGQCLQTVLAGMHDPGKQAAMDNRADKWVRVGGLPSLLSCARPLRVMNVPEAMDDDAFYRGIDHESSYQTHSVMCVPIYRPRVLIEMCRIAEKRARKPSTRRERDRMKATASFTWATDRWDKDALHDTKDLDVVGILQLVNKLPSPVDDVASGPSSQRLSAAALSAHNKASNFYAKDARGNDDGDGEGGGKASKDGDSSGGSDSDGQDDIPSHPFVPFTVQDCIVISRAVNALPRELVGGASRGSRSQTLGARAFRARAKRVNALFNGLPGGALNAAVERAISLESPWDEIADLLRPAEFLLHRTFGDASMLSRRRLLPMRNLVAEPAYHWDASGGDAARMQDLALVRSGGNSSSESGNSRSSSLDAAFGSSELAGVNILSAAGDSALMVAVRCHREDVVAELLQGGADPYQPNQKGETLLHAAAGAHVFSPSSTASKDGACGNPEMVRLLARASCDPFAVDAEGRTPRDICEDLAWQTIRQHQASVTATVAAIAKPSSHSTKAIARARKRVQKRRRKDGIVVAYLMTPQVVTSQWDGSRTRAAGRYAATEQPKVGAVRSLALDRLQAFSGVDWENTTLGLALPQDSSLFRGLRRLARACRQSLRCRRALLAAEAAWLRVLQRGHRNTWQSPAQVSTGAELFPVPVSVPRCPFSGESRPAAKAFPLPPAPTRVFTDTRSNGTAGFSSSSLQNVDDISIYWIMPALPAEDSATDVEWFEIFASPGIGGLDRIAAVPTRNLREKVDKRSGNRHFSFTLRADAYAALLAPGVSYAFKIVAANGCGLSVPSPWSLPRPESSTSKKKKKKQKKKKKTNTVTSKIDDENDDDDGDESVKAALEADYTNTALSAAQQRVRARRIELCSRDHTPNAAPGRAGLAEEVLCKAWEAASALHDASAEYGAIIQHLSHLRRRSAAESCLRRMGLVLAFWAHRDFLPIQGPESAVVTSPCIDHPTAAPDVTPSRRRHTPKWHRDGFAGVPGLTFEIACRPSSTKHGQGSKTVVLPTREVARGAGGVSFVFVDPQFPDAHLRIRKRRTSMTSGKKKERSRRQAVVTVFAFHPSDSFASGVTSAARDAHTSTVGVHSRAVVLTRDGHQPFGNNIMTILVPATALSLSGVVYHLQIPAGAFEVATPEPTSAWHACPAVHCKLRTGRGQVLWDRYGQPSSQCRRKCMREIQQAWAVSGPAAHTVQLRSIQTATVDRVRTVPVAFTKSDLEENDKGRHSKKNKEDLKPRERGTLKRGGARSMRTTVFMEREQHKERSRPVAKSFTPCALYAPAAMASITMGHFDNDKESKKKETRKNVPGAERARFSVPTSSTATTTVRVGFGATAAGGLANLVLAAQKVEDTKELRRAARGAQACAKHVSPHPAFLEQPNNNLPHVQDHGGRPWCFHPVAKPGASRGEMKVLHGSRCPVCGHIWSTAQERLSLLEQWRDKTAADARHSEHEYLDASALAAHHFFLDRDMARTRALRSAPFLLPWSPGGTTPGPCWAPAFNGFVVKHCVAMFLGRNEGPFLDRDRHTPMRFSDAFFRNPGGTRHDDMNIGSSMDTVDHSARLVNSGNATEFGALALPPKAAIAAAEALKANAEAVRAEAAQTQADAQEVERQRRWNAQVPQWAAGSAATADASRSKTAAGGSGNIFGGCFGGRVFDTPTTGENNGSGDERSGKAPRELDIPEGLTPETLKQSDQASPSLPTPRTSFGRGLLAAAAASTTVNCAAATGEEKRADSGGTRMPGRASAHKMRTVIKGDSVDPQVWAQMTQPMLGGRNWGGEADFPATRDPSWFLAAVIAAVDGGTERGYFDTE